MDGFDDFTRDLINVAQQLKGRESKKFMGKEGKKLAREQKKVFRSMNIGSGTGETKEIEKSFKGGKTFKKDGDLAVRGYSAHPLTHLLDKGHIVKDRNGREHGFSPGWNFMEKAKQNFESEYANDCEDFIDELIRENDL